MTLPGGPIEICFSFDTTGSMSSCIGQVKSRVQDLIQRLQADIPGIRMAVVAHGDYCDSYTYITKHIDFSANVVELCDWIGKVGGTVGGDEDECYELVLQEVQSLSWTPGSRRALVMIGDADPHEPGYSYDGKTYQIDWRDEVYKLLLMNVRIYGVQCGDYSSSKDFYNKISQASGGDFLKLEDFANMFDFMMAICYREHDDTLLQNYETEVRARGTTIHKDLEALFGKLRRSDTMNTVVMDTTTLGSVKISSVAKPPSVKALKPRAFKTVRKPQSSKFVAKHTKLMERRKEQMLEKYKLKNLPKLKRENVPESNFLLNDAPWTKWQLAIVPTLPDDRKLWEKRRGDLIGYRRTDICGGQYQVPALYEFAVQTAEHCKRYIVYCKSNKGFIVNKGSWESRLLNKSDVRCQVEDILKKGCRLFVRRFLLNKTLAVSTKMSDLGHYDYAWRCQRNERDCPRQVQYRL